MLNIILVEDEEELARNVISFLGTEEFDCSWCTGIQACRKKLLSEKVDVVLLDLSLPDGLGLELLSFIKTHFQKVYVIIISANHAVDYKLLGLNNGADDYMTKPFSLSELKARIIAVSRRGAANVVSRILRFNEIRVDLESHEFTVNNQAVELTKKEVNLLVHLMSNKRKVLSQHALATHLWGDHTYNLDNIDFVYQQVKNLRKKIKDAGGSDYLKTIYGIGYKWTD